MSNNEYNIHYWVFCESQLDPALRAWSKDTRHADISDEACKSRFQMVSSFLYSEHAENGGLHKCQDKAPERHIFVERSEARHPARMRG